MKKNNLIRLLELVRPYLGKVIIGFTFLVFSSLLSLSGPLIIKIAIDGPIAHKNTQGLILLCICYLAIQSVMAIAIYMQNIVLGKTGQHIINNLRLELFSHIQKLPLLFFHKNSSGALLARVENDVENLRSLFSSSLVSIISNIMILTGMICIMFFVHADLTCIILLLTGVICISIWCSRKTLVPLFAKIREAVSDISSFLTERLQGAIIVRLMHGEKKEIKKFKKLNVKKFDVLFGAEWRVVLFWLAIFFFEGLSLAFILLIGLKGVGNGNISIGTLVMFIQYVRYFFVPIHQLSSQIQNLHKSFAGATRIFDILDIPIEFSQKKDLAWNTFSSEITFENVWFAYEADNWVLKNMSFTIPKGEHWGLVGMTGEGKSTLIRLLLKFYSPQKGRILIDGVDITHIANCKVRKEIGIVFQDLYLFPEDIKSNLRLAANIEDKEIHNAAKKTLADSFIQRLPDAYETILSERGGNLSMGERQLLSFTRLLIHNPSFFIFDEATSSVDPDTEKQLQNSLLSLKKGRTSLTVAHRLKTVVDLDTIIVLSQGSIVERGSHTTLMEKKSYYYNFYMLQEKSNESLS